MTLDQPTPPVDPEWRTRFPAATEQVYLNIGSRGVISNAAKAAADRMIEGHWRADMSKGERLPLRDGCREKFARLLHAAGPHEVAIVKNVSEGINHIATSLDWQPGDNVVLTTELEHGNNIYAWMALRARGVEVREIAPVNGHIDPDAMAAAMDARTRLVTAASVSFTPGFRTDLAAIGAAARRHGAFFLIDAVQSCGLLDLDVDAVMADGVATSTSKGLLGLMGLGFLYVRSEWLDRLHPAFVARHSVQTEGHESEYEGADFAYAPDATRFEIGNYNWTGIAVADTALGELLEIGVVNVERHALMLADMLRKGLAELDLVVSTAEVPQLRSHLVTVGEMGRGDTYVTGDARLNRIARALEAEDVRFSIRRGMLRFGFHLYNDATDVTRTLDIARDA
ncbi:aminotransferase class V-fold PLP-dependent enzyme [Thalassococcus sp. S3]|uniref:aminotransferase class V-fold PLP-dependent enzyme n=1 Tax=Thalassococcus sp. S3 TaxID=2017482 RepID=UPI0013EE6325|nr:aminotransferase class V-fold PLP-dependent enzyme [Thalassococcus sp. S3]